MRNFHFSVITPNEKVYTMVRDMVQESSRINSAQVTLINGRQKKAASQIADAVHSGTEALFAWEPMAAKIASDYPQARVYEIQPSILDLLNCINHAPKTGKLGVIIPFSLRDYYDDLKAQFDMMGVSFYHVAPECDDRVMQEIIRQAAVHGVTSLVGTDAMASMIAAQHINWIPLRPGRGGIVRAFYKALWNVRRYRQENPRSAINQAGMRAHYHLEDIIGSSHAMKEVKELAQTYGTTDSTILLTGESGTGKEMLAQAIHNLSGRRHGPFVAVNCGSITESLLESELFGYAGGTFTGANRDGKVGLFEAANGGTLFLDEVGDMPYVLQNRLLRVLQEKYVRPVGSQCGVPIDVRVIAATNKDLPHEVQEGNFRLDLYYRLAVLPIEVPPLRKRKGDIQDISQSLLKSLDIRYHKSHTFDIKVWDFFKNQPWPGNVRQLAHVIERLVLVVKNPVIQVKDVLHVMPAAMTEGESTPAEDGSLKDLTYEKIEKMSREGKSGAEIAQEIGISRSTVYRIKRRHQEQ
ncbi:sigma-54 interaction domain-containing protein [Megasphaera sp. WILCCON 0056]|uniref:sigma-54 interaction domain-containing protein n=1 Tax=Megasphaera sp. WILCCON 0056 TaxID=3345340 RepID=UPI003A80D4B2